MSKEIKIGGVIETPDDMTVDKLSDAFLQFVEQNGWYFGGGFREVTDDDYE